MVQFPKHFLGTHFFELSEAKEIKNLFKRAEHGITFEGKLKNKLTKKMNDLLKLDGML